MLVCKTWSMVQWCVSGVCSYVWSVPSHSSPVGMSCAAYLDNANGGGIDGGGLREVVQIVNPHSEDLKGAEGSVQGCCGHLPNGFPDYALGAQIHCARATAVRDWQLTEKLTSTSDS